MKVKKWFAVLALGMLGPGALLLGVSSGAFAQPRITWKPLGEPGSGGAITALSVSPTDSRRVLVGGDMLGVGLSTDRGGSWQATTGFRSWEIAQFTWHPSDPNVVWAATMSGPYKSTDGGRTWAEKRAGMEAISSGSYSDPLEKILFDPADPAHLLAFGGSKRGWQSLGMPAWNAVWESADSGEHWHRLSTIGSVLAPGIIAAAYVPGPGAAVLYVVADGQGVYKSRDNGRTWTAANTGLPTLNIRDLAADLLAPGALYAAYGSFGAGAPHPGGVAKTTDGGQTWQSINTGLTQSTDSDPNKTSHFESLAVSSVFPGTVYASDNGWTSEGIFRSTDGGAHWSAVLGNGAPIPARAYAGGPGMRTITVDPHGPGIYAGDNDAMFRSLDGGGTWADITSKPPSAAGTWEGRGFSGLCANAVRFNPYADQTVLLALDDGKFWSSTDTMKTWRWGGGGLSHYNGGSDCTFAGTGGKTIYALFGEGPAKSTDGGKSWAALPLSSGKGGYLGGIYALPGVPNTVWIVVAGQLYKSVNGGSAWAQVTSGGLSADGKLWGFAADPRTPKTFYVGGGSGIWKTADGITFALMPGSPSGGVLVDPTQPACLYVVGGGLLRYDGGRWSRLSADSTIKSVAVDPANGSRIVYTTSDNPYHDVSSATGVWLSEDRGATWTSQNTGLALLRAPCVSFNPRIPDHLLLGTEGRGFWIGTLSPLTARSGTVKKHASVAAQSTRKP